MHSGLASSIRASRSRIALILDLNGSSVNAPYVVICNRSKETTNKGCGFSWLKSGATAPAVMGRVLGIVTRAIANHLIKAAGVTCTAAQTGAVTLIQRFGDDP